MSLPSFKRPHIDELRSFAGLISARHSSSDDSFQTAEPVSEEDSIAELSASEILQKLDYHGITLLAQQAGSLNKAVLELIGHRRQLMVANESLKRTALLELVDYFASQDLERHILFKGSALAYTIYDKPWLRPRSDNDMLIDFDELPEYHQALEKLGYKKHFEIEGKHVSYQHSYTKTLVGDASLSIDLHWKINNRQILARSYNVDELLVSAQTATQLGENIHIPSSIDCLIIACLHRLGHHAREERLTWLNDIYLLTNSLNAQQWRTLIETVKIKKLAAITLDGIELAYQLFGGSPPSDPIAELTLLSEQNEPSRVFLQRELPEWRLFWHDLGAMPDLKSKIQLLRENIFPNSTYVRQRMQTDNIVVAHGKRIWRGVKRVIS